MKETICVCDLCKSIKNVTEKKLQIIFTTEQNEGKFTEPYLENIKIDICDKCVKKVLTGKAIFGKGAMGHNEYSFKKST